MIILFENKEINLPDFLIVGAAKSGTTSLFYYLSKHSNIFLPEEKEPHFFSFYNNPANFDSPGKVNSRSNIDNYSSLFKGIKANQITGEGSTSYLYDYETTINNIKHIYKEKHKQLKIIILLRNPVNRAWSQYWQFRKFYFEPLEFEEAIKDSIVKERINNNWSYYYDYMGFGNYYDQVKAYLDNFESVKVILQENLLQNTSEVVDEVLTFLDLEKNLDTADTDRRFNPSGKPKKNIYGLIWAIKNQTNIFSILKSILPLRVRKKITYFFMENAMERQKLPKELKQKLSKKFTSENQKLYELIKDDKVLKW